MCIVADSSNLTNTKIYSYQLTDKRHGFVYSNTAESYVSNNAMLLPIPADVNTVQMLNGTSMIPFLEFADKCCPKPLSRGALISKDIRQEKVGMYNVSYVGASKLKAFLAAAEFETSFEMIQFLLSKYSNWSFLICEWEGKETISTQPMQVEFDTLFPTHLYFPMMDGHGEVPEIGKVERDHLLVASAINSVGEFNHELSKSGSFDCFRLDGMIENGDSWLFIETDLQKASCGDNSFTDFSKTPGNNF